MKAMRGIVWEERKAVWVMTVGRKQTERLFFEGLPLSASPPAVRSRLKTAKWHGWGGLVREEAQDPAAEKSRSIWGMMNRGRRWSWHGVALLYNKVKEKRLARHGVRRLDGLSVSVVFRLVGAFDGNADVVGLLLRQNGQLDTKFGEMEPRDLFV